jgi:hypothetical protein
MPTVSGPRPLSALVPERFMAAVLLAPTARRSIHVDPTARSPSLLRLVNTVASAAKERFTRQSIGVAMVLVKKSEPWSHRDWTLSFNSALQCTTTAAAALRELRQSVPLQIADEHTGHEN